jgi:hypothetical protein
LKSHIKVSIISKVWRKIKNNANKI